MTAGPRTLPIRVAPVPGEALDSWHEALAARLQATPADLAAAMLPAVAGQPGKARPASTIMLSDDEAAAIAGSCQLSAAAVHGLTLARYDGVALRLDRQSRRVVRNELWGRAAGSRFCPQCLAQTGGRWQLAWRLGWSFACLHHGRLLADACPQCGRMQRRQPHPQLQVPRPGSCACPAAHATGAIPPRCGADLAAARTLALAPGHPVLTAQQFINDIITTGQAATGIYASRPQPAHAALADVRALAATILGTSPDSLAAVLPADIAAGYAAAVAMPHKRHGSAPTTARFFPGSLAPASAAVAAAAVTAAVRPLARHDPRDAANGLRQAFRTEQAPAWSRARDASPALDAVRLAALGRIAEPPATSDPAGPAAVRARQAPALFWPAWTARLMPPIPGTSPQARRRCLSAVFLAVTTGTNLTTAARMLGGAITYSSAAPLLLRAERDPRWPAVLTALARLAGYLDQHGTPIDYQRRRLLDYSSLLPDTDWIQACRDAGAIPGRQSRTLTARRWLFERISGLASDLAPAALAVTVPDQRARLDKFTALISPGLAASLDGYASTWLAASHISGEEVTWRPPARLLSDLDLPGPDPFSCQPSEIHELITRHRMSPRAAARHAGTTIDVVRAVLGEHPAPPQPLTPGQARSAGRAIAALRARLSPRDLDNLYTGQRTSLRQLSRQFETSRNTISALLDQYQIPRRTGPQARPSSPIDHGWLYEQYVTSARTLPDIAAELGISKTHLNRRAKALGIPLRRRGTPSHARTLHSPAPTA
jgi:hypothetical protein